MSTWGSSDPKIESEPLLSLPEPLSVLAPPEEPPLPEELPPRPFTFLFEDDAIDNKQETREEEREEEEKEKEKEEEEFGPFFCQTCPLFLGNMGNG